MKKIYVAGAYSANNTLDTFNNMRKGMRAGLEVLLAGYAPFVPWFDYHLQLMLRGNENLMVQDYYNYSLAWLEVSDALYVILGSEKSVGTQNEIKRAQELNMPIYYNMEELKKNEG